MKATHALAAGLAILAIGAAACSSSGTSNSDKTATAVAGPRAVSVQVDGTSPDANEFMIAYFPDQITLHAGDTVNFTLHDSGEPHTVTFGTQFDPLYKFIADNCPGGLNAPPCNSDTPPPDLEAQFNEIFSTFPSLLPDGPGDANPGPANPCFMDTGTLTVDKQCPKATQPAFNGKQSVYNSGWLGPDSDFVVKLADDIAPGDYKWICLLHGPEMTGTLTIVAKTAPSQSAEDVKAKGKEGLDKFIAALKPAADGVASATLPDAMAGASSPDVAGGVAEYGPSTISIPVGGSVTWTVDGAHTISFNTPEGSKGIRQVAADGTIHVNDASFAPVGTGEPPAPSDDPNAPPPLFDGGTFDGSSVLNSGLLQGGQFKLTFSKAGTFTYKCLIHDNMEGTVKVGS